MCASEPGGQAKVSWLSALGWLVSAFSHAHPHAHARAHPPTRAQGGCGLGPMAHARPVSQMLTAPLMTHHHSPLLPCLMQAREKAARAHARDLAAANPPPPATEDTPPSPEQQQQPDGVGGGSRRRPAPAQYSSTQPPAGPSRPPSCFQDALSLALAQRSRAGRGGAVSETDEASAQQVGGRGGRVVGI